MFYWLTASASIQTGVRHVGYDRGSHKTQNKKGPWVRSERSSR